MLLYFQDLKPPVNPYLHLWILRLPVHSYDSMFSSPEGSFSAPVLQDKRFQHVRENVVRQQRRMLAAIYSSIESLIQCPGHANHCLPLRKWSPQSSLWVKLTYPATDCHAFSRITSRTHNKNLPWAAWIMVLVFGIQTRSLKLVAVCGR